MSSVAKGIRLSSYNTRSIIVSGLVLLLVIALFFIPEIIGIGLQHNLTTSEGVKPERKVVKVAPVPEKPLKVEQPKRASPLDSILAMLRPGRSKDADEGPSSKVDPKDKDSDKASAKGKASGKLGDKSDVVGMTDGPITWKVLKGRTVRTELGKAEQETVKFAATIDDKYSRSKYALLNLAGGLKMISRGMDKTMSAEEAFQYLEKLDGQVTQALLSEKADASTYNRWADISLGKLFERTRAYQQKISKRMPFDPKFRVVFAKINQPPDHFGKFIEGGAAYVNLKASVTGTDTTRVSVYRNGIFLMDRAPRGKRYSMQRFFTIFHQPARGIYTFRVYDKHNHFIEKSYNFYQPARRFAWIRKENGTFGIPFGELDPRFDRMFLFRNSSAAQPLTYFSKDSISSANTF